MGSGMEKKKGFTLIELLVVISIIAMLMAILIPALKAAKAAATGSVCVSNLHSLSMAWFTYTVENEGKLVNGHVEDSGNYKPEEWVWPPINATGGYVGNSPGGTLEDEKRGIEEGALFDYIKDAEVYHCPADKRYRRPPTTPGPGMQTGGYRSYSIAGGMNGEADYVVLRYTQIRTPAEKYVFVEEKDTRGFNRGSWLVNEPHNLDKWKWTDPLAIWHNKKSALGWADGHATMHRWVYKPTIEMSKEGDWDIIEVLREDNAHENSPDLIWMKKHWAPRKGEGVERK